MSDQERQAETDEDVEGQKKHLAEDDTEGMRLGRHIDEDDVEGQKKH